MRRKYERKAKGKGYNDDRRINYDRKDPTYDYLKYFRIVRYWAKKKYGLGLADIEMIMFLYSERLFKRSDFNDYQQIFSWNRQRFQELLRDGWISKWRSSKPGQVALYEVSYKGKRLVKSFYKKLSGEEPISESRKNNPMFKADPSYSDKIYRRAIKKMNDSTRQLRHHAQE